MGCPKSSWCPPPKPEGQVLVGFAAETDDVLIHAVDKLRRKNCDLLVANDVSQPGAGFEHDTNQVSIIAADGSVEPVAMSSKRAVAERVWQRVAALLTPPG